MKFSREFRQLQPGAMTRRTLMLGLPLFAAGCGISPDGFGGMFSGGNYGSLSDEGQLIPALDLTVIDRDLLRTQVSWSGKEKPGSVVVKIPERHLFLVLEGGRALRYSVGVGRAEALNFRIFRATGLMRAAWKAASTIRWARGRCISIAAAPTLISVCTAPRSRRALAARCRAAASGCSTTTSSISITACRPALR
jgi:hypothetical protein